MPHRMLRVCTLVCLAMLCIAQVQAETPPVRGQQLMQAIGDGQWRAGHLQSHPLVGRFWSPQAQAFLEIEEVAGRLAQADVILLGEVHDNPDHQRLQLAILEALYAMGRPPALLMEIFDRDDQPVIEALRAEGSPSADEIATAVGMQARGWDWEAYRPLVQWVLDQGMALHAANISSADATRIVREGLAAVFDESERAELGLLEPLPESIQHVLATYIVDAHCGYLPLERTGGMVDAQRARDAWMARLLADMGGGARVLVAGAGHVRADFGVPVHWREGQGSLLGLGLVEVHEDRPDPADYPAGEAGMFDIVWFTPRQRITDPCDDFREQLQQMRQ